MKLEPLRSLVMLVVVPLMISAAEKAENKGAMATEIQLAALMMVVFAD